MTTVSGAVALARRSLARESGRRQLETMSLVRIFALLVLGLVTTRWAFARQWLPSGDPFGLDSGIRSCAGGM
jgi:hypothetical protein